MSRCAPIVFALGLLGVTSPTIGEVLYRETFGRESGSGGGTGPLSISSTDWTSYFGNASTNATLAPVPGPGNNGVGLVGANGLPQDLPNVNADTTVNQATGLVQIRSLNAAQDFFAWTSEYTISRTANPSLEFHWQSTSAYGGDTQRLAVRIADLWFVSTVAHALPSQNSVNGSSFEFFAQQQTQAFNPAAGNWLSLTFAPDMQPLTLGGVLGMPLPAGDITAFGLFTELADASVVSDERTFFDTFTVTAVPEPTSWALAGCGGLLLLGWLTLNLQVRPGFFKRRDARGRDAGVKDR